MVQRYVSIITSVAITSLLLFHFQNCGPANVGGPQQAGGEMRVIEDWNKSEIQFVEQEVQVHDEAEVTGVSGLCSRSHNGRSLRWAIWAGQQTSRPMLNGESRCEGGQFNVTLDELPNMVCGVKHLLVVEGDWGGSTFTHVLRRCQPLASELVEAPVESPQGTLCSLEYQMVVEESGPCTQVCYRDNKVVLNKPVDKELCSGIAAKLRAGL